MKKTDINQALGLLANFGVLVGLVFVGFELRQSTLESRSEGARSITESVNAINAGIYSDPELAELIIRGKQDVSSLDQVERERFDRWNFSRLNIAEYILDLERGGVSDLNFQYIEAVVQDFQRSPGLKNWVRDYGEDYVGSDKLWSRLLTSAPNAVHGIEDVEQRWNSAIAGGDQSTYNQLLADDFTWTFVSGSVINRQQTIESIGPVEIDEQEKTIREYENTAVVTGIASLIARGRPLTERFVRVWVKSEDGAWQLAYFQATEIE
jgi:ketosteroid isomerase-like protein